MLDCENLSEIFLKALHSMAESNMAGITTAFAIHDDELVNNKRSTLPY